MTPDSNAPGPFHSMAGYEPGLQRNSSQASDATSVQQNIRPIASESQHLDQRRASSRPVPSPAYHDEGQLNRMLPPRRELPFSKTGKRKSPADSSNEMASKQVVPQSSAEQPANAAGSQRLDSSNENNASSPEDSYIPDSQPQSQPLVSTQQDPTRRSPEFQNIQPYPAAPSEQPRRTMIQIGSPEFPHAGCNGDTTQLVQTQEYIPARPTTSVEDRLEQYIASPSAERIAFLENWMCELIDDNKFVALCQDVEGTWRRFAFGKKT